MTQIGDVKRVHMIGVGGSSMSGLAGLLKDEGYEVSGSDRTRSHKTEALEAHGVKVLIGHRPENVRGADVIVYSAAKLGVEPTMYAVSTLMFLVILALLLIINRRSKLEEI